MRDWDGGASEKNIRVAVIIPNNISLVKNKIKWNDELER